MKELEKSGKVGRMPPGSDSAPRRGKWNRRLVRLSILLVLFIAIAELAGCCMSGVIAGLIVHGPNTGRHFDSAGDPTARQLAELGVTRQLRVDVGPPAASLLVWIIDPPASYHGPTRGTIFCLHGHDADRRQMLGPAKTLAGSGFRTVLYDLRANGRSSGDWLTYGVIESRDARQLLTTFMDCGLVIGQVGAFGRSYGGATAIEWAGIDPRLRAVVSVSAFANMREAVYNASWTIMPGPLHWLLGWTITPAVDRAGKMAGFDPDVASPVQAIQRTNAAVLLMHGASDWYISPQNARELHAADPEHSMLDLIAGKGHNSILEGESEQQVVGKAAQWFLEHLAQ